MSTATFEKQDWVEMFREIGLSEDQMHRWHAVFEQRWPEAHQSFLEWLRVPGTDIERIRQASRNEWA